MKNGTLILSLAAMAITYGTYLYPIRQFATALRKNWPALALFHQKNPQRGAYFVWCCFSFQTLFSPIVLTDTFLKINKIAKLASIRFLG